MSLKLKIYEAIKQVYPKPYPIDEVFGIADLLGHKQSLAERKCRELVHSGLIDAVKNDKGYNVAYKWIKPEEVNYPQVEVKKVEQNRLGFKLPPILA